MRLTVRRFLCGLARCHVKTFAEQIPGLTSPYARFTVRAREMLTRVGLALAGRAGSRLADALGLPAARMTLLRLIRAVPDVARDEAPLVLGVDEFALRKGHVYGTILVDMATRRPVDLLADREVASFAGWLAMHPGAQIICRDRAGGFAEGARMGAPGALHVADRWHLYRNLAEAVERVVSAHRGCLREPVVPPPAPVVPEPDEAPLRRPDRIPHRFRDRVHERHAAVHLLLAQGYGIRAIARELGLGRHTVQRYARAAAPGDLLHDQWQQRTSPLGSFKPYLSKRLTEGCGNARVLHQEIKALGIPGSYAAVRDYVRGRRPGQRAAPAPAPGARTVTSWLTRHPAGLDEDSRKQLARILRRCPELQAVAGHVRAFAQMMTHRDGHLLDDWIFSARYSGLPPLASFARGLSK